MLDAIVAVITNGDKVLLIPRAPTVRGGGVLGAGQRVWRLVSDLRKLNNMC